MKIKILHLYHDLMNLYGEYANISVLCRHLESVGAKVELDKVSVGDDFNLSEYDFIYCGAGTERNQIIALDDLKTHSDELIAYAENEKTALFTGNSLEMLGNVIFDRYGFEHSAAKLADFSVYQGGASYIMYLEKNSLDSVEADFLIRNDTRITGDAIFTADFIEKPVVGFVNKCGFIEGSFTPLFSVKYGIGNNKNDKRDGVRVNNILGTYLTGPLLVKNPAMLTYIAFLISNGEINVQCGCESQNRGYEITLSELTKRFSVG